MDPVVTANFEPQVESKRVFNGCWITEERKKNPKFVIPEPRRCVASSNSFYSSPTSIMPCRGGCTGGYGSGGADWRLGVGPQSSCRAPRLSPGAQNPLPRGRAQVSRRISR